MKEIIEVKGKKYEECSYDEWAANKEWLSIITNRGTTYYKEVKEEFKSDLDGYLVTIDIDGDFKIGTREPLFIDPKKLENLLKEYKEYLKR